MRTVGFPNLHLHPALNKLFPSSALPDAAGNVFHQADVGRDRDARPAGEMEGDCLIGSVAMFSEGDMIDHAVNPPEIYALHPRRPFNPDTEGFVVHIEGIIIGEVQPDDLPSSEDEARLEVILEKDIEDVMAKIREKQTGY